VHLRRCAFEEPPAAGRKKRVTAEENSVSEVSDMISGVSRNGEHAKGEIQSLQLDGISLSHGLIY
jgi:hypothetical protein